MTPADKIEFTIPAFIEHFKNHDKLQITKNIPFILKDVWLINGKPLNRDPEIKDSIIIIQNWPKIIFNPLLQIIAKKLFIDFNDKVHTDFEYGRDFKATLDHDVVLIAKPCMRIETDLIGLFRLMTHLSMKSVKFTGEQTLEIPLKKRDIEILDLKEDSAPNLSKIIASRLFADITVRRNLVGDVEFSICKRKPLDMPEVNYALVSASQGMEFTLLPKYEFHSVAILCQYLNVTGQITIPENQPLTIIDSQFFTKTRALLKKHSINEELEPGFILQQMVLSLGKGIGVNEKTVGLSFNYNDNYVKITPNKEVTFTLQEGSLQVYDLSDLACRSITAHRRIIVKVGHSLTLYGVKPEGQPECVLRQVIIETCPVGMEFSYSNCMVAYDSLKSQMSIKAKEEDFVLYYCWKSLETVIENLLNTQEERDSLAEEGDVATIQFLQFKVLFYFCCGDFKHFRAKDILPPFFDEAIQEKMLELINNAEFDNTLQSLTEDQRKKITLLTSNTKNYHAIEWDKLEASLKFLLTKVKELNLENPSVKKAITNVALKLRETDSVPAP